jgi:hypothetical protein
VSEQCSAGTGSCPLILLFARNIPAAPTVLSVGDCFGVSAAGAPCSTSCAPTNAAGGGDRVDDRHPQAASRQRHVTSNIESQAAGWATLQISAGNKASSVVRVGLPAGHDSSRGHRDFKAFRQWLVGNVVLRRTANRPGVLDTCPPRR